MPIPNLKSIFKSLEIKYLILDIFGPKLKNALFCMKFGSQPNLDTLVPDWQLF